MVGENNNTAKDLNEKIWEQVKKQISEIKYGTVLITVHDGRIMQVETSKKIRFNA